MLEGISNVSVPVSLLWNHLCSLKNQFFWLVGLMGQGFNFYPTEEKFPSSSKFGESGLVLSLLLVRFGFAHCLVKEHLLLKQHFIHPLFTWVSCTPNVDISFIRLLIHCSFGLCLGGSVFCGWVCLNGIIFFFCL